MKELFLGTRQTGKTEYLINKVSEDFDNGLTSIIVCPNKIMCMFIADTARTMGKFIPNPITIGEFVNYNRTHLGTITGNKKFYFDELQMSLGVIAGRIPIETVVIDVTHSEIIFKDMKDRRTDSEITSKDNKNEEKKDGEWIEEPSLNSNSYWKVHPKVYRCSKCRSRLTTRYIQKQRFCYYCGSPNRPRRESSK